MTRLAPSLTVAKASKSRSSRSSPLANRSRNSTVLCWRAASDSPAYSSPSELMSGTSDSRALSFLLSPTRRIFEKTLMTGASLPVASSAVGSTPASRHSYVGPGPDDHEWPARSGQALEQRLAVAQNVLVDDQPVDVTGRIGRRLVGRAPVGPLEGVGPLVDMDPMGEVGNDGVAGWDAGFLGHHADRPPQAPRLSPGPPRP